MYRSRRRTVPILLYLRDHVTVITSTPDVALPGLVRDTLGRYGPDEPQGWFEQRLHNGACLVLLDGLDEVARPEDRRGVADWVERQIRQYPKNDYVITSRPQGYRTAPIDGAAVLQVRSFTDEQVTRFLKSWYLAVERHSSGATGDDVRLRAEEAADDLLQRLNGAPALYELTVNPLLLTMIATVHHYRGALPGSRVDLYGEICQVMLWRRQEAKKLSITLDGDKKEALLRRLAFAMMQRQVRDLPRAEVLTEIRPALLRMSRKLTAEQFLTDITSNGLLIERESGVYSFAHQTFQEYLAASHIRDKGLVNVLVAAIDDVWWRETTLLYTARSDADPVVRACLGSTTVTALSLAADCADQGNELAPELRDQLDDLLAAAFDKNTDPDRRRLMARVMLTRHLHHPTRTGNGSRVYARPISAGLYQLYQQDTQRPAPDGPIHRGPGTDEPITGVRGSDAVAFVQWANGITTSSDTVYRLPNLTEITDSALHRTVSTPTPGLSPNSVWLERGNAHGQPELWTPVGTNHPHLIEAATLTDHVKDDIKRSTATLTRLLLLQSIITIRVFNLGLDRDLARTRDRARDLDRTRDLARARDLARDLASELASELAHARELASDLDRDLTHISNLDRDLTHALDHTPNHVSDLDHALDRPLHHDLDLKDFRGRFMGSAMAQAFTRVLSRHAPMSDWPTEFAQEFVDKTGIAKTRYTVSSDDLADKVHNGPQDLMNLLRPQGGATQLPWAHQVAINLRKTALPIFNRQQPLTTDTATAIRLAALCLAAEADVRKANQLGDTFRELAAGVTLLERRATGQAAPTETIMLAIT